MSNTGGDDGEGFTPLSPDTPADDAVAASLGLDAADLDQTADGDDGQPPPPPAAADQNPDNGGTQDTSAVEQPQQENDQGAAPVREGTSGPRDAQSQGSNSVRAPSPSGSGPATPSRNRFLANLSRWVGGNRGRRSSSSTADNTGNVPQRSNTSIASGSRPVSVAEESEPTASELQAPELVGPSRRRLNSQGSSSQGSAGSPPGRGNAGSRATRADTGLSLNTDVADLEAIGENTPTPIGVRNRLNPFGPRSADGSRGSLPNTPADTTWEHTRRNRAFLGIYDQMRTHEVVARSQEWQQGYDNVRDWMFQLGVNAMDEMANEGVASMRDILAALEANVPAAIRNQILGETRRRAHATRDRVNNALVDESNFVENTATHIINLIENAPATQSRRRGISRASRAESLASNASQPELHQMDRRALLRTPREQLVDRILAIEQGRREAIDAAGEAEDRERIAQENLETARTQFQADINGLRTIHRRETEDLQQEVELLRATAVQLPQADPPTQGPVDQPPTRDNSEGSPQSTRSRSRARSAPRSPERERTFQDLRTLLENLARHEALVRRLQVRADLNPGDPNVIATPFSANAELSRAQLLLQLRNIAEERDEIRRNETRLQNRVQHLEALRASPPSLPGTGLFSSLFGGNSEQAESAGGDARSRSGSRAGPATPLQNLADELEEQGSGGSSDPASRQSPGPRRQSVAGSIHSAAGSIHSGAGSIQSGAGNRPSVAGSRHSNASSNNSADFMPPPEPAAVNPVPLRAIPEWLATHPNGPCGDCEPIFRFPPELGELPNCGCTCDLALGNPPPPAGSSPGAGSSRSSRAGSGRSVRFVDDRPAAEGDGGRRPAPLDLSALVNPEENNADRPNTPYPADAEGGQPGAPATGEQAEAATTQAPGGEGSATVAPASGEQAEAVPIQPPEEEGPPVEEPAVEAPAVVAPVGRRGGRCPCCGRGAYGDPPVGGLPQVAFYICRNMAGQPMRVGEPISLAQGLRNALGLGPAGPRPAGPEGRDGGDQNPPAGPEPPANGPAEAFVPGPGQAPRDGVMRWLTVLWDILSFFLFPLETLRQLLRVINWFLALPYNFSLWALYWNLTYFAGQYVARPTLPRLPMWEIVRVVLFFFVLWFITMFIAVYEERRIWGAANAHRSAAYYRGLALRRPYPLYPVFEVDAALAHPAFGKLSEWLNRWYFRE